MQPFLQAQKSRRHTRFGSVAAQATPTSSDLPAITAIWLTVKGSRREYPIYQNNAWVGTPLNLKKGMEVTINYDTTGTERSRGFLYATFSEKRMLRNQYGDRMPGNPVGNVREYLFIRAISPEHQRFFRGSVDLVVPEDANNLTFYLTKNLPIDVYADYIYDQKEINMLKTPGIVAPLPPNPIRSPGLGAPTTFNKNGNTNDVVGSRSEHYDLWDGKLSNHRWSKHGYTGGQLSLESGQKFDGPDYTVPGDPWRTIRSSLYQWRDGKYKEFGGKQLKGWDAVRINAEIPAGTPMCIVFKAWWHDRESPLYHPEWHKYEGKWNEWDVWVGPVPTPAYGTGTKGPKYYKTHKTSGDININLTRGNNIHKTKLDPDRFVNPDGSPFTDPRGRHSKGPHDIRSYAFKVEWWDYNKGEWTKPQVHPPHGVTLSNGKGEFIFRLPRQIGLDNPELADDPQWSLEHTWDSYPVLNRQGSTNKYAVKRGVIGRMQVTDPETGKKKYPEVEHLGRKLTATDSIPFHMMFGRGHEVFVDNNAYFRVADPKSFAYVNNPAFSNVYWKEGEFSPGSTMIVIGQGLNRVFDIALTTKKNDDAWKLSSELYDIDRSDENLAGTQRGDMLKVSRVITADVLLDSAKSAGESEVKEAWKNVFGVELAASWFDIVGTGGKLPDGTQLTPLKNQSPSRSTHYRLEASGEVYEFPYSIAIIKIPKTWVGPVLDFEIDANGEPYLTSKSLKTGTKTYLTTKTAYLQTIEQEMNLDEEIQYQLDMLAKGLKPSEVLVANDTDNDAIINTAAVVDQDRKDNVEDSKPPKKKGLFSGLFDLWPFGKKGTLVSDSVIRRNTLIPVGKTQRISGLGSAPIFEDVTNKYSADHITNLGGGPSHRLPSPPGVQYDNFDEIEEVYVMNGKPTNPSLGWFAGVIPESNEEIRPAPVERLQVGNMGTMYSRATGRGNPMEVTLINGVSRPFRQGDRRRMG